jgi:hypothetical protein
MNETEKAAGLAKIADGVAVAPLGKSKYRVGAWVVHVRYCSQDKGQPERFKFNINPNTLSADYELWVCGNAAVYYLMPISFMRDIYSHPDGYVDRMYPGIRVVSVNTKTHTVTYASPGVSGRLKPYFRAKLAQR